MDDIENKKLFNNCGIDESIDISDIADGEIRPIDTSNIQKNKLKKRKKNYFWDSLENIFSFFEQIKNSKNPEMIIIINSVLGIFFYMLSDPPILLNQTFYFYIDDITSYLKISIFMIFLTAFFFSVAYLIIYFMRKKLNKFILILPLLTQFILFISSDNKINDKINFGIYRKFTLILTTLFFFSVGIFIQFNQNFLKRKTLRIKITTFIFYFTLIIYLNLLFKGLCEKNKFLIDENLIDNSIGCNTEDYENKSCYIRVIDELFDFGSFFSKKNLEQYNFIDEIYLNKINEKKGGIYFTNSSYLKENIYNNSDGSLKNLKNKKFSDSENKNSVKFEGKKIYVFPDLKNLFFENYLLKNSKKINEINLSNNNTENHDNLQINIDNLNPHEFVDLFLENIISIDTGIQIEISLNKEDKKNPNQNNNLEVKNPINLSDKNILQIKKDNENEINRTNKNYIISTETNSTSDKFSNNSILKKENNIKNSNEKILNSEKIKNSFFDLNTQEIFYDNRDQNNPFININPQLNPKMEEKRKKLKKQTISFEKKNSTNSKNRNTIILINFENIQRIKFKHNFPYLYSFMRKFSRSVINNNKELNVENIGKAISKNNLQSFQFFKFFPNFFNFSSEKNFTNFKILLNEMNDLGYLTMFGATDLTMNNNTFNEKKNSFLSDEKKLSKNFYEILESYDKIILQKFYSKFENLILKKQENENNIFFNKNLILEYSTKFISRFSEDNKFVHLKFDQTSLSKELDKELFLWLKNIKKILHDEKFYIIFYSNISDDKPFYISEFSDIFNDVIEQRSMMFFSLFPASRIDTSFLETIKINENFPSCECDFYEILNRILGKKNSSEKYNQHKNFINDHSNNVLSDVLCREIIKSDEFCKC